MATPVIITPPVKPKSAPAKQPPAKKDKKPK